MANFKLGGCLWGMLIACSLCYGQQNKINSIDEYRKLRNEKLNKPRAVIHNNDGGDAFYFPVNESYSVKNFLDKRSSGLIGTDVSVLSYTTITSGFGNFTHNTRIGEVLSKSNPARGDMKNITAEMIAAGTDPLNANVGFAHENGLEIFWSNRMNDTHDAAHRIDQPYTSWTKFKENNPQYLFGKIGERLPHGRWSSVDFDHQEIRDLCVAFYREVCENYDVDGVELDFFRHFELFKSVAEGGEASREQLDKLTDMVRKIRKVTEEAGMKKGKPILVLMRLPDAPGYAEKAGVDIRRWIDEDLLDILVGSCYFRLDYWENFVRLGENKNVKIYAGLSESRVKDEHPLLKRQQNAVFRARAAAAWQAGVDGLYSFNEYNTRVKYLSQIGAPAKLKSTNNLYFVTYRDYNPERYLKGGSRYLKLPRLTSARGNQKPLLAAPLVFNIELGDESEEAKVYIQLWGENNRPDDLVVKLNDSVASFRTSTDDGLLVFEIDPASARPGINELVIQSRGNTGTGNQMLKDAAVFFLRDKEDMEMKKLITLCNSAL